MGIESKTYIALSVVMFLEYAVWGAWAPVLAARLLGPLKMTGKQTGWIYATLPIACIVSPLVAGWLGDQFVSIRWILIAAHFLGAVLLFVAANRIHSRACSRSCCCTHCATQPLCRWSMPSCLPARQVSPTQPSSSPRRARCSFGPRSPGL